MREMAYPLPLHSFPHINMAHSSNQHYHSCKHCTIEDSQSNLGGIPTALIMEEPGDLLDY